MSSGRAEDGPWSYRTLGVELTSDIRFRAPLPLGSAPGLRVVPGRPIDDPRAGRYELAYSSRLTDLDGRSVFELWRRDDRELMRFVRRADFEVGPGVVCASARGAHAAFEVENLFLSAVLAYLLELRGIVALHAAAVEIEGRAVAFLAPSGGGKSTLAAALVKHGLALVTDDVLAIEAGDTGPLVRPAYPQVKLNEDAGRALLGSGFADLRRFDPRSDKRCWSPVTDGHAWCAESLELGAVYVLDGARSIQGDIDVEALSRRAGVRELLRAGFTPALVEAVGLAAARLERLAGIAASVPVRRLAVVDDLDALLPTAEAVARDFSSSRES